MRFAMDCEYSFQMKWKYLAHHQKQKMVVICTCNHRSSDICWKGHYNLQQGQYRTKIIQKTRDKGYQNILRGIANWRANRIGKNEIK